MHLKKISRLKNIFTLLISIKSHKLLEIFVNQIFYYVFFFGIYQQLLYKKEWNTVIFYIKNMKNNFFFKDC